MSYEIRIIECKTERKMVDGKWDSTNALYAPNREENVETKKEIYKQAVAILDLVAVISAINEIELIPKTKELK